MKNLKRTTRRFGAVRGHRAGVSGEQLLPYVAARNVIYLPSYRWVLRHRVADLVQELEAEDRTVVFLDYTDNGDLDDVSTPLSHAALIVQFIESAGAHGTATATSSR